MKRFQLLIIILLLLVLIGLLVYLCFFRQPETEPHSQLDSSSPPPVESQPGPDQQTDALASEELQSGLVAEVVHVARTADGLVEVRWRYRNPTETQINLCSNDEGQRLVAGLYCSSGGQKYKPAELSGGKRLASPIPWTDVPPSKSVLFWAKFDVPAENTHIAFFVPGLLLPMEDLAVASSEQPAAAETSDDVLAAERHTTGLIVEVEKVRRTAEDLVEVRWRYRNPTDQGIQLFNSQQARDLPFAVYLVDNATRTEYLVHCDAEGVPTASASGFTTVAPGKSVTVFARFPGPPQASESVTFYVPYTPPLAGLRIE